VNAGSALGRESREAFVCDMKTVRDVDGSSALANEGADDVGEGFVSDVSVVDGEI
jgi:hypothetical protein